MRDIFGAIFAAKPRTNFTARIARRNNIYPVAVWSVIWTVSHNLNRIAALQFIIQRHKFTVDLRANAFVADRAVNAVGEVDWCGTFRKVDDLSGRGEEESGDLFR